MTDTLESLYSACHESAAAMRAYDAARADKVAEIEAYIRDHLDDPSNADAWAERLMNSAEDMGRLNGDEISGELPGQAATTGNPLAFSI